jgi:hypothetical protein
MSRHLTHVSKQRIYWMCTQPNLLNETHTHTTIPHEHSHMSPRWPLKLFCGSTCLQTPHPSTPTFQNWASPWTTVVLCEGGGKKRKKREEHLWKRKVGRQLGNFEKKKSERSTCAGVRLGRKLGKSVKDSSPDVLREGSGFLPGKTYKGSIKALLRLY